MNTTLNSSLYNAAASLTGKAGQTVGAFIRLIEGLRQETANLPLPEMVEHAKFGVGVIVATEGRGGDARVQVNFGGSGMKWLALEYAKLTPV